MINLAGRPIEHNDRQIANELARCGIDIICNHDCGKSEVQTTKAGVLVTATNGKAKFTRAWNYWVVECQVPIGLARAMYANPVGKTDIRVGGHCGCPSPDSYGCRWYDPDTGKKYIRTAERMQCEGYLGTGTKMEEVARKILDEHLFHDNPASIGAVGTVDSYHIDTELGLYIFVLYMRGALYGDV
ncbi:MAG: hypothetical protein WC869_01365 [Phycisphaerae bacterium]|jgi:hypothetical protein